MIDNFEVLTGRVEEAIANMREVAQWCIDSNLNMWKLEDLSYEKLIKNLKKENFCLGILENEVAASMILQWHDPLFWPDIKENESGYIHKLCVNRKFAGKNLSQKMVSYAINECKKRGIKWLRLDTDYGNGVLCSLYEGMGFVLAGRKTTNSKDYALYELSLS